MTKKMYSWMSALAMWFIAGSLIYHGYCVVGVVAVVIGCLFLILAYKNIGSKKKKKFHQINT